MHLFTADFHIGGCVTKNRGFFVLDTVKAKTALQNTIIKHGVKHLYLAGDTFDKNRVTEDVAKIWWDFCTFCTNNNCRIYLIPGDHELDANWDGESGGLPEAICPWVINMSHKTYDIDGYIISGIPNYRDHKKIKELLQNHGPCDVLLMHTAFRHLLGFEGAFSVGLEDIPSCVKNVVVGDVHITDRTAIPQGGGYVFSPGCLHAQETPQLGQHYGWLTDNPANGDSYRQVEIFDQPREDRTVYTEAQLGEFQAEMLSKLDEIMPSDPVTPPTTYVVQYGPDVAAGVRAIEQKLGPDNSVRMLANMVNTLDLNLDSVTERLAELGSDDQKQLQSEDTLKQILQTLLENVSADTEVLKKVEAFLGPILALDATEAKERIQQWRLQNL